MIILLKRVFALSLLIPTAVAIVALLGATFNGIIYTPYDLKFHGAACDGATDDTTALNTALAWMFAHGNGTLHLPVGRCRINGQVLIPNDGDSSFPKFPALRITGAGAWALGGVGSVPLMTGGSILDLRYSGSVGKIQSLGFGKLEIDHVTLTDGGTDTTPFVYVTSTTLMFHHNSVYGNGNGQDVIVLGGTTVNFPPDNNGVDNAFQGYGTVIDSNFFDYTARSVLCQEFCNSIQVVNNTTWFHTAGNAAFEINSPILRADSGRKNYFAGNLTEMGGYVYGIKLVNTAAGNTFVGNSFWDQGGTWISDYYFSASRGNVIVEPHEADARFFKIISGDSQAWDNLIVDGMRAAFVGPSGVSCGWYDIGKIWFQTPHMPPTGSDSTPMQVCQWVSGTPTWVTK
jgi:hypothetical protein